MSKVRIVPFEARYQESYREFARGTFGADQYQASPLYLRWLYDENPSAVRERDRASLAVTESGAVVGCVHKMRLAWRVDGSETSVVALHNLMVSEEYRGGLGFTMLRNAVAAEDNILIPGVTEPLASLYGKMGYHELKTRWYRRLLAPAAGAVRLAARRVLGWEAPPRYFQGVRDRRIGRYHAVVAPDAALLRQVAEALNESCGAAAAPWWTEDTVHWRFFHPSGPRHLLISDSAGDRVTDLAIVSLGPRHGLNVARITALAVGSPERLGHLLRAAGRLAGKHGAHLLLTFAAHDETARMIEASGWRARPHPARTYVYHRGRPACDSYCLMGAAGDFGFEGIPLLPTEIVA